MKHGGKQTKTLGVENRLVVCRGGGGYCAPLSFLLLSFSSYSSTSMPAISIKDGRSLLQA